jgi:hypothetical protein
MVATHVAGDARCCYGTDLEDALLTLRIGRIATSFRSSAVIART